MIELNYKTECQYKDQNGKCLMFCNDLYFPATDCSDYLYIRNTGLVTFEYSGCHSFIAKNA